MTLYNVAAPAPPAAKDINQLVRLLTGATPNYLGAQVNVATTISAALPGASAASRFVGGLPGTQSGPPTTGTFLTGDWLIDPYWYVIWICTAGGTPGTWVQVGAGLPGTLVINQSATGQSLTTRTGRTGFDVVVLDNPFFAVYTSLYNPNVYGWVTPRACTASVEACIALSGPTSGAFYCQAFVLQNGIPVLFGDGCERGTDPSLTAAGIVRLAAGDVLQLGVYAEAAYATDTSFVLLSLNVEMMGS